jgi:hypothetical protein
MKPYALLLGGLICAGGPSLVASGLDATATFTDSLVSPGDYQYDLTLNNTGSTTIGTFWFSWVPGAGFMSVSPTDVVSPSGWQDMLTNGGGAIQWTAIAPSDDLATGGSLTGFEFDSTLTPAEIEMDYEGLGTGHGDPITTAFVYSGAPFSDAGLQIAAAPAAIATPEPATTWITALGFGLIALSSALLRGRKKA